MTASARTRGRRVKTVPLYDEAGEIGCGHIDPDDDPGYESDPDGLYALRKSDYDATHEWGSEGMMMCLLSPAGTGIVAWTRWTNRAAWELLEETLPILEPVTLNPEWAPLVTALTPDESP